ncbi:probable ATP-dependent RNA helicase vasa-like [Daphnia magna]|uniref:probable ATP-dependent RNA helicase vasa-like n=1 Tax=Daphnia magna TaxID=35525 RepID=UPI001E1BC79D|nr:probable ATP-dependent RNA helicase vasa-like [Daphnia magna]XP_032788086.2 probable ATP-dependent RNA helicase vasa-like [Daphnia magna]XP_032788087.2 probable ATP-dependent RNA helicase vasa-like [Daphnia magna]XP_032788089.2 probable ATP-dependent RNA helicase vasa-like [Daphnia magna]XP_045030826.1 probable ATP-dependent RNA helicase vasa-like [Daphnia magna]XP_045030827.1 probable ATP-dependent RNA helicase vasa-like [Daphnia magna]
MGDDWDEVICSAPSQSSAGGSWNNNNNQTGIKPPAGRGRGAAALASQMNSVKISSDDEWGVGVKAEKPVPSSNGWDAPAPKAGNSSDWGAPASTAPASSGGWNAPESTSQFKNDFDDQPRGGGWGSSGANGLKSTGGGRPCHKCGEEGHMARECPKGGGGGGGSRACHKCGEEGHFSRECPQAGGGGGSGPRTCHKCGEEGHFSRECPQGGGGGGGGGSRACHKCGEEGHFSRECPQGGGGGGSGPRTCHKCGEEGHVSRDCPQGGGGGDSKCFKCHEAGHTSKDCPNPFSELTEDGKPREQYIPEAVTCDEKELFKGIVCGERFNNFDKVVLQVTGKDVPQYITSFEEAGLRPLLLQNIKNSGYIKPTPVQKASIAVILAKRDLIACAVTGSGKTAAYLVPVMNILLEQGVAGASHGMLQKPEVVIVAPTRELAIQIHREACKFSYNSVLKSVIIYGGTVVNHQRSNIQAGCNILVATAGRLKDFLDRGIFDFTAVKFLILDEADRMLDMGFGPDIEKMVNHPTMPPKGIRRVCMFSATFPDEVQALAATYMEDYIFVTTGIVGGTNPDVEQLFFQCSKRDKRTKLMEVLQDLGDAKTIVFVDSKKTADFVAAFLCNNNLQSTSIHGDRLQSQREQALRDFKNGVRNILVATNVAARGLDIAGVNYVVNYDLPTDIEEYVHRVGRTGRVGNIGKSISFFDDEKDGPNVGKFVSLLTKSNADVPPFMQAMVSGVSGMGYDFGAPSSHGGFASRDVRRFGDKPGMAAALPTEAEESWD